VRRGASSRLLKKLRIKQASRSDRLFFALVTAGA